MADYESVRIFSETKEKLEELKKVTYLNYNVIIKLAVEYYERDVLSKLK